MSGLKNLKIFNGINEDVVNNILDNCKEEFFKAGDTIFVEGEVSNGKGYIIKNGNVDIKIKGQKIAELNQGDIFGEIALLNEEERTATVIAATDLVVIVLSINNLIEMINNDENTINKEILRRIEENLESAYKK
nr:cyclic nucleotide-binding domain-containing protein [Candidatus Gracilibacteria bacterium]